MSQKNSYASAVITFVAFEGKDDMLRNLEAFVKLCYHGSHGTDNIKNNIDRYIQIDTDIIRNI